MFPTKFHLSLVARAYGIDYRTALENARNLGILGFYVTDEEAFDIANYGSRAPEVIVIYNTIEIIHSRLNNTTLENL